MLNSSFVSQEVMSLFNLSNWLVLSDIQLSRMICLLDAETTDQEKGP